MGRLGNLYEWDAENYLAFDVFRINYLNSFSGSILKFPWAKKILLIIIIIST